MAKPYLPDYTDKRTLIVDDIAEMRTAMRGQATSIGIQHVTVAGSIRDALEILQGAKFDIILCDYYLGAGPNGQQFLEFLRRHNVVSRATVFCMITAEKSYERVVVAAECLPDDYLLKPFTADMLRSRLDRLMEKKQYLSKVDRMQDQGRWADVIHACDEIIAGRDKYLLEATRIKGNALIMSGRMPEAAELYRAALAVRPLPWAKLGLAQALRGQGEMEPCAELLNQIIEEDPRFMAAYDLLGEVYASENKHDEALKVLDDACTVSPHSLARHRAISGIAENAGDLKRVETALSFVVERTRNSPLRESNDYARLSTALVELGEAPKALTLIEEAKLTFRKERDASLLSAVEAVAHHRAGNEEKAKEALDRALKGNGPEQMPVATALALARACVASGRGEDGEALLKRVVQNNPDRSDIHEEVVAIMATDGDADRGAKLIETSEKEIVQLNNDAVAIGRAGDLDRAGRMLLEAASRLPGNLAIVANASYALLVDMLANSFEAAKLREAERLYRSVLLKDPQHPRLPTLAQKLTQVRERYTKASP